MLIRLRSCRLLLVVRSALGRVPLLRLVLWISRGRVLFLVKALLLLRRSIQFSGRANVYEL